MHMVRRSKHLPMPDTSRRKSSCLRNQGLLCREMTSKKFAQPRKTSQPSCSKLQDSSSRSLRASCSFSSYQIQRRSARGLPCVRQGGCSPWVGTSSNYDLEMLVDQFVFEEVPRSCRRWSVEIWKVRCSDGNSRIQKRCKSAGTAYKEIGYCINK